MQVYFALRGVELSMLLTVPAFLTGPVMSRLSAVNNNCDPKVLVEDQLPADFNADDDDELAQVFEEALYQAAVYDPAGADPLGIPQVLDVELHEDDLPDLRRLFLKHPADPTGMLAVA
jgi:hypothetical protein